MPNWCFNKIQFDGGEHIEEMKEILRKNPDGILDFEDFSFKPKQRIDPHYNVVEIDDSGVDVDVICLTGWSPPIEFLEHMSLMYPGTKITLQFCEASNMLAGESTFEASLENEVSFWSSQLGNWENPSLSDLEDEEEEALYEKLWDADPGTEEVKELMDKVFNKDLSDFMFKHFGGPVGG